MNKKLCINIAKKTGRLGNRLIVLTHFLGAHFERGVEIENPSLCEYSDLFEKFDSKLSLQSRERLYSFNRLRYKIAKIIQKIPFARVKTYKAGGGNYISVKEIVDDAEKNGIKKIFTQSYFFRYDPWVFKHRNRIIEEMSPKKEIIDKVKSNLEESKASSDILVGVHIRGGDYKDYLEGKFYFELEVFYQWMKDFENSVDGSVCFVVTTDRHLTHDDFKEVSTFIHKGDPFEDMIALSQCDYVMGPPSSFSGWAAFFGNAPLLHLTSAHVCARVDSFNLQDAPDNPECL